MQRLRLPALALALPLAALGLQGCVAKAVAGAVMLPVRAAEAGIDAATTTQSEADEDRGRAIRKREERLGKLERQYEKAMDRCGAGDDTACEEAQALRAEMKAIMPGIPVEPGRD